MAEYVTETPEAETPETVTLDITFQEAQRLQGEKDRANRRRKELEAQAEKILAEQLDGWEEVKSNGLSLDTEAEEAAKDKVKEKVTGPFKEAVGEIDETVILEAGNGAVAKVVPISFNRVYLQNI